MSDNHIPIKYFDYKGKDVKLKDIRFNGNTQIPDLEKAVTDLANDLRAVKADYDGLKKHYNEDNVLKSNKTITAIQRVVEATSTTIIQGVTSGTISSGSSSAVDSVRTVTKSLTGGVASPEVFEAPAVLMGLPIAYATVEGMASSEILVPSSLTVTGFSITAIQDSTVIYSYLLL